MTRRTGVLDLTASAGPHDHAAWGYSSRAERAAAVSAWLAEGLATGYRALYVADAEVDELFAEVARIPDARGAVDRGALVLLPTTAAYDLSQHIDPDAQLAMYASVVDQALADGYAGLRVAADITPLVLDPARRESHLAWEQFADAYIAGHPLAPLCLYDTTRVSGIDPIVCVHALQGPDEPGLAVFASDTARRVHGEVDGFQAPVLAQVLRSLPDSEVVLDLTGIEFIDARGAWILKEELDELAASGRSPQILATSPQLDRVWKICGFSQSEL